MIRITEALVAEHSVFCVVFDQIERALPALKTVEQVTTMARLVEGLLTHHGKSEQDLAYVALDHVLANKGEIDRLYEDHREQDERLQAVRKAETAAEARRLLMAAMTHSREHFRYEEENVFPLIERTLQRETLVRLGDVWREKRAA
ncbi:MAG: hemerythrin domain-containing protein [Verrucomicrobia bacterium]|nr:hemerythrin domain-containing protein [Verrucomicrobiota bacterium]